MKLVSILVAALLLLALVACGGEEGDPISDDQTIEDSALNRFNDPIPVEPGPTEDPFTLPGGDEPSGNACPTGQKLCCSAPDDCYCTTSVICPLPSGSCTGAGCRDN